MVTDPIADMLTRIRNGQAVSHQTVVMPYSKLKHSLAKILEKEGWLGAVDTQGRKIKKVIEIHLKYEGRQPVITGLRRISKPGRRTYVKYSALRPVKEGYGLSIVSTSKGLMSGREARQKKLGGELICEIW